VHIDVVEEPVEFVLTKSGLESEDLSGAETGERLQCEEASGAELDGASKSRETYLPTSDVTNYRFRMY
jgi:hypothetical protein